MSLFSFNLDAFNVTPVWSDRPYKSCSSQLSTFITQVKKYPDHISYH